MTPATRSQTNNKNEESFEHLIRAVMNLPVGCDTEQALGLAGLVEGMDLAAMDDLDIDALGTEEVDEEGTATFKSIPSFKRSQLRHMRDYLRQVTETNGGVLTKEAMMAVTKHDWDQYRIRPSVAKPTSTTVTNTTVTAPSISTPSPESIELSNFLKGIKRDKTQYPSIKDERDYHTWVRSFLAIANSHKIEEVFDPDYVPSNPSRRYSSRRNKSSRTRFSTQLS